MQRHIAPVSWFQVLLLACLAVFAGRTHATAEEPEPATATPAALERVRMPASVEVQSSAPDEGPSTFDQIWRFAEWYRDDTNPVVQRVQFSGRFQHDFARVRSDQGHHDEWNVRRLRLGGRVTLFRSFIVHGEAELNPQERDPFYMRLTDFSLQWRQRPSFVVTAGKQGVPFTSEGATSSRELIAIDRSNLANNLWFPQEYMTGLSVSGTADGWTYRGGVYSAGAANREFGEFSGGLFTLALLGYDFGPALGLDEAVLTGNYVYQQEDPANTFTRELAHVVSVHFQLEDPRWGARADVSTGVGYLEQSDIWSVMAMPFVNVTEALQFVGRYTFVNSDEPNGVRLATYENRVVSGRGDRYREVYAGVSYYFYEHRLKLQSGVQWGKMRDLADDGGAYSGVAWTSGIRVGW